MLLLPTIALANRTDGLAPAWVQGQATDESEDRVISNEPVAKHQLDLLELAFSAASAFPTVPHAKNRCRAQYEVVEACLELGQPLMVHDFAELIDDWRRGAALAEFAAYCAQRGEKSPRVRESLKRARVIANNPADEVAGTEIDQAWRRDRVLAKVALAEYLLGEDAARGELMEAAMTSGNNQVALSLSSMSSQELLESEFELLASSLERNDFEHTRGLLETLVELFDRHFDEELQRNAIEARIRTSWGKLPLMIRMELLTGMARAAAVHSDGVEFSRLRTEAFGLFEAFNWMPEDRIELEARWAGLRNALGETETARIELARCIERFEKERERIYDIHRADALRAVAETYSWIGDLESAKQIYLRTLAASLENPNSRPRADDFVATCCSMALNGFEPDEEMWARLQEVEKDLGIPW